MKNDCFRWGKAASLLLFLLLFPSGILSGGESPFQWKTSREKEILTLQVKIPSGYYLYADETKIDPAVPGAVLIRKPVPVLHKDELGESRVYNGPGVFLWEYCLPRDVSEIRGQISFQGCRAGKKDSPGICFMPETIAFPSGSGNREIHPEKEKTEKSVLPRFEIVRSLAGYHNAEGFLGFLQGKKETSFFRSFGGRSFLLMILLAVAGGFALNLTPCVLPMIPVNLAIIGADGKAEKSRKEKILRGCMYGSGIAAAYGLLGVIAVFTGTSFGVIDSTWYFNAAVAFIFVLLALSMFGILNFDVSKFRSGFHFSKGAGLVGIFLLGAVAAVLAGACVAPVVAAALIQASKMYNEGNHSGLLLPFFIGAGMALPWPVIAAGIGILPKPGKWMKYVKFLFGCLILLTACYYAVLSFHLFRQSAAGDHGSGRENLVKAIQTSSQTGKYVLIDFRADWCKNCLAMERTVLNQPEIREGMKDFLFVKFQANDMTDLKTRDILSSFKVTGLPTFVIVKGLP